MRRCRRSIGPGQPRQPTVVCRRTPGGGSAQEAVIKKPAFTARKPWCVPNSPCPRQPLFCHTGSWEEKYSFWWIYFVNHWDYISIMHTVVCVITTVLVGSFGLPPGSPSEVSATKPEWPVWQPENDPHECATSGIKNMRNAIGSAIVNRPGSS